MRRACRRSTSPFCASAQARAASTGKWSGTVTSSISRNRRYLALWLPFLPTDRLNRLALCHGGRQDDRPMVVAALEANAMRLVAADRKALSVGLEPGLSLADARA